MEHLERTAQADLRQKYRVSAARALGQLKDPRAVAPLMATLQDEDMAVRAAAAEALGRSTDREVSRVTKRVLSAKGRAAIAAAARRRWAKVRARAKKGAR